MSRRKRMLRNVLILLICVGFPVNRVAQLRQQNRHERAFIAAVTAGDERQVRAELRWGVNPNTRDVPEQPLGWRELLQKLLHRERMPNRQQYAPALLLAERYDNHAIARLLLQAGADPNTTDSTGNSPLMLALRSSQGNSPVNGLRAETALLMLAKGADPNTHDSERNALQAALDTEKWEVARQLILRGANVNARDHNGASLLLRTTFALDLTELMVSKGADINAASADGTTVLMEADEKITPLLLAHGANVHAKNKNGDTALLYAGGRDEPNKVRMLLRYGVDCAPAHNHGWDLLRWSASHGLPDLVRYALAHGLKVNTRNDFQRTPLMLAAANGDEATVRLLLAHGANVNTQDKAGMTALTYATQEDKTAAVQLLLQQDANPRLKDREHKWTAAQYAEHFGCENAADLLRTGHRPPALPAEANPTGDAKRSRIRVDANRWLVRTPLTRQEDPNPDSYEVYHPYAFRLVDSAGRQGEQIIVHYYDRAPAMFAFHDVDGRCYTYVEEWDEGQHPGGAIYLAKGLELFQKWSESSRYGLDCVPLPYGGALIHHHEPGRYLYDRSDFRRQDDCAEVFRFRNGVVKDLGFFDTPGE